MSLFLCVFCKFCYLVTTTVFQNHVCSILTVGVLLHLHQQRYLQVTIWRRGGVVLAAPATGLGPSTPAGAVIQLLDGGRRTLHCVEVPWKQWRNPVNSSGNTLISSPFTLQKQQQRRFCRDAGDTTSLAERRTRAKRASGNHGQFRSAT